MGWQKCPICEGHGIDNITPTQSGINPCPTCKGKRMVSMPEVGEWFNPSQSCGYCEQHSKLDFERGRAAGRAEAIAECIAILRDIPAIEALSRFDDKFDQMCAGDGAADYLEAKLKEKEGG